jgi:hypothetical protein
VPAYRQLIDALQKPRSDQPSDAIRVQGLGVISPARPYLLAALFQDLPVEILSTRILFGAYDNIIARWPTIGRTLRGILLRLEHTPLRALGLSHFSIVEKL